MKAIVMEHYGRPGEVLEFRDIPEPAVGDDDVLVRVRATSVNPADWHMTRGEPRVARVDMGLREPKEKVLGCDLTGTVEAVGAGVTAFKPGDEVFGSSFMNGFGGFAELASISAGLLASKPANLSFEQAAAVPLAALTALQGVRDQGGVESGQQVLIIGASGGVGTFAVQLARHFGAEVTGVCSTPNVDMVLSLGAHHVIDYTRDEFTARGRRFDVVVQVAGTATPLECRRALVPKGTLVAISGDSPGRLVGAMGRMLKVSALSPFVAERLVRLSVESKGEDMRFLRELLEAGELVPVIDRTYPLSEVPEALEYIEQGHAQGKVTIT